VEVKNDFEGSWENTASKVVVSLDDFFWRWREGGSKDNI